MRRVEFVLTSCLVFLKIAVLRGTWGLMQGFDAIPWIDVFRATRWFRPLPGPKNLFNSYHPPLSYLVGRLIYALYPHEVEMSQLLSTLSILVAVFALRSTLKNIGVLWTLPGLAFLYVTASLPLVVWMSIETSYDALVFAWFVLALQLSVKLFWAPTPPSVWRRPKHLFLVALLGAVLAAGLLTKFNGALVYSLPFLVVLARSGLRPSRRDLSTALAAAMFGVLLVSPLYYTRYYRPLGTVFPQPIEWLREDDLKTALALRNAHPFHFLTHMLRIPTQSIIGTQEPVTDSFVHSIWLQIWKRDIVLGEQVAASRTVSDFYIRVFPFVLGASTLMFLVRRPKMADAWRRLGRVLLPVSILLILALLYFGWKYPIWDWRVFKAKYITAAMLWIPYCVALLVAVLEKGFAAQPRLAALRRDALLLVLMAFMFVNHLMPVY